jgi:hypothetical protein
MNTYMHFSTLYCTAPRVYTRTVPFVYTSNTSLPQRLCNYNRTLETISACLVAMYTEHWRMWREMQFKSPVCPLSSPLLHQLSGFLLTNIQRILCIPFIVSHWESSTTEHTHTHTHTLTQIRADFFHNRTYLSL